jgi:2-keto-4-pentenoate hydratase/2-oxohepta-3-ene-1,7-dioic acid hydratase in catechol pathway
MQEPVVLDMDTTALRIGAIRGSATEVVPVVACEGELRTVPSLAGRDALALLASEAAEIELGEAVAIAQLGVPLTPSKIVGIGLNYLDHIRETGMERPKAPLIFAKFPSTLITSGQPIVVEPAITTRVDWEVELAVVIGREARHVEAAEALDYVWGYAVANDVSARDVQFSDGQWVRGKSLDTFCPISPLLVSRHAVEDPQSLRLITRVNGEVVQDSSTAEMLFSIADLIAYCSRSFVLLPGDLILTGTPWGCGEFMDPPRCLQAGDVVEVEIPGLGVVSNPVEIRSRR